ncbi:MAG: hypothetical protein HOP09_17045 [Hyphomicrobium sp.]|nr:hypothetical protein [Hyphomicrobium sp.]
MRLKHDYHEMVQQWKEVCALPMADSDKALECEKIFQVFIGRIAMFAASSRSPTDVFYAYMLGLENLVRPNFALDLLGQIAVCPAHQAVWEWLLTNNIRRL